MTMKRAKLCAVLLLFCIKSGAFIVLERGYEVVRHNYKGHIDTRTSASNETIARWTISGDLYTYRNLDFFYLQLDNVKTSIFNGPKHDLKNVQEKPIPPEAEIIQQMFAVKVKNDFFVTLHFKENEPLWSINMKKGIYSFIEFEYEKPNEISGKKITPVFPEEYVQEKSVYGNCTFQVTQNGLEIEKKMNGWNCTDMPFIHEANYRRAPGAKDFYDVLGFQYSKVLTLKKRGLKYLPNSIVQKTIMEYRTSPSALYSQIIEQEQSYEFSEAYISLEKINASEFVVQTDLIYETSEDRTLGRHVEEKNSTVLAMKFLENYDAFIKRFNYSTPKYYNIREDYIFNMFQILKLLDADGFEELEKIIFDRKDQDLEYTFVSLIPYVGSKASVNYLINYLKSERINGNIGFAHKIFATFPRYIKNFTVEMLVDMEPFINYTTNNKSLKNAAVLSFASSVGQKCEINKKYETKYVEIFYNDFLEKEDYEERMTKLLGLVNMASCIDYELMNSITTNISESTHLRALAFTGFKDYLKNYSKVYETYWTLVQNITEPFEVRVRALDLLLSSNLTEDQFKSIVRKYSESISNFEDRQLANYVLSTLHSIKKSTSYNDYLGEFALEALKNNKIPIHPKEYATGYYRLTYSDSVGNFGSSFGVRIITDPETNILDTIQVSFNNFANSVDFGTYTLYIKLHGFINWAGVASILKKTKNISSAPDLVNLLKEYNFEIKTSVNDIHIDIVLFIDNTAVFTSHYSKLEQNDIKKNGDDLIELISVTEYVSFPILEYVHISSDFGTPIKINNYLEDISKHEVGYSEEYKYRSSWSFQTWFDIYNPLADTYISSFKYYIDEKNIMLNYTAVTLFPPKLKWLNEKDSYAQFWDNMMGTMVEEDTIKEYCSKCEAYSELDTKHNNSWTNYYEPLGFNADIASKSHYKRTSYADVSKILDNGLHQYNVDALPYAGPIFYFVDIYNHKFWLKSELSRGSIRTWPLNGYENISETDFEFTFQVPGKREFGKSIIYQAHLETTVKDVDDIGPLNSFNMTTMLSLNTEQGIKKNFEFYVKYNATNPEYSFKMSGYGDLVYPNRRTDTLSLLPFKPITGETTFVVAKNIEDDEDCATLYTYVFKEVYASNNIEVKLENDHIKNDYDKCSADSKDLKFTAPTTECKKVSSRITEYDNYTIYFKAMMHNETHNETIIDITKPSIGYSRLDENTININFANIDEWCKIPNFFKLNNLKVYYPKPIVDPAIYAFSKYDSGILSDARSICISTPSKVQQFSGNIIPIQRNEWLAFAECYNVSTTGLKARTIGDRHMGFTFYSFDNVVEATVNDGKANITLNGTQLTEFYSAQDQSIRVYFLNENVLYIMDKNVEIYYNTQYVGARVLAIYPKLLCGVCV